MNTGLEHYFPADLGLRIIAEPGRFYVTSAFTLAVNVIAKRAVGVDGELADGEASSLCAAPLFHSFELRCHCEILCSPLHSVVFY